jgi:hypothetical protein
MDNQIPEDPYRRLACERSHELAEDSRYQQQVNTNLTEISDWVTKIIVGLGLINLKDIPGKLVAAGNLFAKAVDSHSNISAVPLGVSIVVAFIAIGFLFGYLTTRLVLAGKLAIADIEAQEAHEKTESITARLESLRACWGLTPVEPCARK